MLYCRPGSKVAVGITAVGEMVEVGTGVSVGLRGGVGTLSMTVAVGGSGGESVAVGTRVLVGDGSAGTGVSRLAVGKKLGKVGVSVGAKVGVWVGVDVGKRKSDGAIKSTMMAIQVNAVKPPITLMMIASVLVTLSPAYRLQPNSHVISRIIPKVSATDKHSENDPPGSSSRYIECVLNTLLDDRR